MTSKKDNASDTGNEMVISIPEETEFPFLHDVQSESNRIISLLSNNFI